MADNPRIEELRRRVEKDPASIAFAQLAEEYRRAGSFEEAVATCRGGLATHPSYLSARVTLGRALFELNNLDEAQTELEHVLQHAPENLAAIRGLGEIHHRKGELGQALSYFKTALGIARHDPDLEQTINEISRAVTPARPAAGEGLTFEQATAEFEEFLDSFAVPKSASDPDSKKPIVPPEPNPKVMAAANPALPRLEAFLDAIHMYRQRRTV